MKTSIVYKGETSCQSTYKSGIKRGLHCTNNAYYLQDDKYLCGVHSKKDKRTNLIVNPMKKQLDKAKIAESSKMVTAFMKRNRIRKIKGSVKCCKLRMMKAPKHINGYLTVFPNFKHGNHKDGYGISECSPMSLGPVKHKQPRLPDALNLENFWQGSKCTQDELLPSGRPNRSFYKTQREMFLDKVPHRHKHNRGSIAYWVWKNQKGKYIYFNYVAARQFYCTFYQRLCSKTEEFKDLVRKRDTGFNLLIAGYDGYDIGEYSIYDNLVNKLEECYLDGSRPFGHELCLLTMLVLKEEDYPWLNYKSEEF